MNRSLPLMLLALPPNRNGNIVPLTHFSPWEHQIQGNKVTAVTKVVTAQHHNKAERSRNTGNPPCGHECRSCPLRGERAEVSQFCLGRVFPGGAAQICSLKRAVVRTWLYRIWRKDFFYVIFFWKKKSFSTIEFETTAMLFFLWITDLITHMIDTGHWYVDQSQSTSLYSGVEQGAGTETSFVQLKVQSRLYLQDTWD